jgi:ribose transport system ATP-binding protein
MEPVLKMKDIYKRFSKVEVLHGVDFEVNKGEVHALIGENGAGKSTLMKILSGAIKKDSGEIIFCDKPVDINSPKDAKDIGIRCIYQELSLLPHFSVANNMYICSEDVKCGFIQQKKINEKAKEIIEDLGLDLDEKRKVYDLGIGEKYFVEICRCLTTDAKLVIMDEPTSAMTSAELARFYKVIDTLKKKQISIIFISHKLDEIMEICDRVTIMRDGKFVTCKKIEETSIPEIVKLMIGRDASESFYVASDAINNARVYKDEDIILSVKELNTPKLKDISFDIYKGEILGIAGLLGAGKTELIRALFGADKRDSGTICMKEGNVSIKSPSDAMKYKLGYVPEDRKTQGLMQTRSISDNISLINLDKSEIMRVFVSKKSERQLADECIKAYNIISQGTEQRLMYLSGGNQQRVVLAKWLAWKPDILLLDEPTRGVDVGAKAEIYGNILKMVKQGITVVVSSAETPELLRLCDRIAVLYRGRLHGTFMRQELDKEKLLIAVSGE